MFLKPKPWKIQKLNLNELNVADHKLNQHSEKFPRARTLFVPNAYGGFLGGVLHMPLWSSPNAYFSVPITIADIANAVVREEIIWASVSTCIFRELLDSSSPSKNSDVEQDVEQLASEKSDVGSVEEVIPQLLDCNFKTYCLMFFTNYQLWR